MKRLLVALQTWLPSAALLCSAACTHAPDVVADFEASSNAGPGASAGTTGKSPGSPPDQGPGSGSGSGGTFEVSGTNARGDAGVANDGGVAGSDASPMEDDCRPSRSYIVIQSIVDDGCKLDPTQYAYVRRFVEDAPPPIPMGETHIFGPCDFTGGLPYFEGAKLVLCDNSCDAARKWVADQECEAKRCLGLSDCDTEDAGS